MNKNSRLNTWWGGLGEDPAYIDAVYEGGVFVNSKTKEPLVFRDGTYAKIKIASTSLPEYDQKNHHKIEKVELLKKGSVLYFKLPALEVWREFEATLLDNLIIERKGNRTGRLLPARVSVYDSLGGKVILEAGSLNQAYTQTSVKVLPEARTHTANAFKVFFYEGRNLDSIRPF